MGLFNINYSKPGPGVSKNEPEKKRFFLFWELYARKFFKLIIANMLYALVSLPVVTRGLAQAGLTYVTRNYSREKHVFLPADFFDTIKKNWKQGLIAGILELLVGALLGYNLYFYGSGLFAEETGIMNVILTAVVLVLMLITTFARYYLYLQLITFRMSMKQMIKNSLLFAFIGMKQNFLIFLVLLLLYALGVVILFCLDLGVAIVILLAAYIFLFPAFRSFLIQFTIFPLVKKNIIDPYYEQHPDEDLDKRRDLNLDTGETPTEEEAIFEDRGKTAAEEPTQEETVRIPKQYSAEEMRRARRVTRDNNADDDGTI